MYNNNNINNQSTKLYIYSTSEYNKENNNDVNNNSNNDKIKIRKEFKEEINSENNNKYPSYVKNEIIIDNNENILSTNMNTKINYKIKKINSKQNSKDMSSNGKIKIKKDLFNINARSNDENYKYTNLDLEVINSWNLPKGLKLHINKDKLENSLRRANDGKIYFGFEEDINNCLNGEKNSKIDYILMPKDNEYDDKFIGIHFMIKYDENEQKYYIKDLGSGYGTFIKLVSPLEIITNLLINIGDTYIVFTLDEENDDINLKLFTGDEQSETYNFSKDNKIIIIGRDKSSDICIEDKLLSRKQCYIYYQDNENLQGKNKWFIVDGDINGKKSTNDTWMYTFKDNLIYDQMVFKTNHNLFKCHCY